MVRQTATAPATRAGGIRPFTWTVIGQFLPATLLALAIFLAARSFTEEDAHPSSFASVSTSHASDLAANIAFFEDRVLETNDHLSYNRLTSLYLQRLRETGDVADVRRAETSALRSLDRAKGDYNGLLLLAQVRLAQHDFEAATALANQAIGAIPARADGYAILGDAQFAMGNYSAASESYRFFLVESPGSSAFSRQAVLAEVNGNVPLAEQFWKAAIDSDRQDAPENSAWARVQLANLYFNVGRLDTARAELETALNVYPGYPFALAGLARVAAAEGHDSRAIDFYQQATARIPLPEFVAGLADVYTRAGMPREASQQLELMAAFEQLLSASGIRDDLTMILFAIDHGGDTNVALQQAEAAYGRRPSLSAADTYAWALYRAGRFDDARLRAVEALRTGTKDPLFLFHAGAIAHAQGDYVAAEAWLQQADGLNPDFSVQHSPKLAALLALAKDNSR